MQAGQYGGPRTVSHRYTIVMTPAAAKNFSGKVNMILSFFCKMRTVYNSRVSKFYEQQAFFKTEPAKLPLLVNFAPQPMLSWGYRKREGGRYHHRLPDGVVQLPVIGPGEHLRIDLLAVIFPAPQGGKSR